MTTSETASTSTAPWYSSSPLADWSASPASRRSTGRTPSAPWELRSPACGSCTGRLWPPPEHTASCSSQSRPLLHLDHRVVRMPRTRIRFWSGRRLELVGAATLAAAPRHSAPFRSWHPPVIHVSRICRPFAEVDFCPAAIIVNRKFGSGRSGHQRCR